MLLQRIEPKGLQTIALERHQMRGGLIVPYFAMMYVLGTGTMLYGIIIIIVRQKARLTRTWVLYGSPATASGLVLITIGFAFTYFMPNLSPFRRPNPPEHWVS